MNSMDARRVIPLRTNRRDLQDQKRNSATILCPNLSEQAGGQRRGIERRPRFRPAAGEGETMPTRAWANGANIPPNAGSSCVPYPARAAKTTRLVVGGKPVGNGPDGIRGQVGCRVETREAE